jgi:hypothetical protein
VPYLIYSGLPLLNLLILAFTLRKEKEKTPPEYWKLATANQKLSFIYWKLPTGYWKPATGNFF